MANLREQARAIWQAAVNAADPISRVREYLEAPDSPAQRALRAGGGVYVFGGGKAGAGMAHGVELACADHLDRVFGIVNVPDDTFPFTLQRIHLWPARPKGSNHPTDEGVKGVQMQFDLAELLRPEDLALCLFSGGGSALLPAPVDGVSLEDKQAVTKLLHSCGASIDEMNCVRKHLSRYKGGRFGERLAASGCQVLSLIVSDVIGDRLDVIASGPTAPDPTTLADALDVLRRYKIESQCPRSVLDSLTQPENETAKRLPDHVSNVILCNNKSSLDAASTKAESLGYRVLNLGSHLQGETRPLATALIGIARSIQKDHVPFSPPTCLLSGGETTVTLTPDSGKGGRNQEFVLASLLQMDLDDPFVVLSGGTDGEDGPTDAAGGIVDAASLQKIDVGEARAKLDRHDAYVQLEATGDLLKTGLTHTNVMDVRVILIP